MSYTNGIQSANHMLRRAASVNEQHLNLEKMTSNVLSLLLLIYWLNKLIRSNVSKYPFGLFIMLSGHIKAKILITRIEFS